MAGKVRPVSRNPRNPPGAATELYRTQYYTQTYNATYLFIYFFFFYKKFMPNAKVTYSSRMLIQGMQPKEKETRDREKT